MIRNTARSFGLVAILFHWIMAGLFLMQFWIGLTLESEPDRAEKALLTSRHISIGFVILFLWLARALWTCASRRPALPVTMERGERLAAKATHMLLFWLLFVTPMAGWAVVSAHAGPVPLRLSVFGVVLMPRLPLSATAYATGLWTVLHAFLAYLMLFLAGVHTLAAFRHQFTLKDNLLKRMIVPGTGLSEK